MALDDLQSAMLTERTVYCSIAPFIRAMLLIIDEAMRQQDHTLQNPAVDDSRHSPNVYVIACVLDKAIEEDRGQLIYSTMA